MITYRQGVARALPWADMSNAFGVRRAASTSSTAARMAPARVGSMRYNPIARRDPGAEWGGAAPFFSRPANRPADLPLWW